MGAPSAAYSGGVVTVLWVLLGLLAAVVAFPVVYFLVLLLGEFYFDVFGTPPPRPPEGYGFHASNEARPEDVQFERDLAEWNGRRFWHRFTKPGRR